MLHLFRTLHKMPRSPRLAHKVPVMQARMHIVRSPESMISLNCHKH